MKVSEESGSHMDRSALWNQGSHVSVTVPDS